MCIHTSPTTGKKFKADVSVTKSPDGKQVAVIIPEKQVSLLRALLVEQTVFSDGDQGALSRAIYEELGNIKEPSSAVALADQAIKVGSKVKVVKKVTDEKGWRNSWTSEMSEQVGSDKVFTVREIREAGVYFTSELVWQGFPKGALQVVG